MNTQLTQSTIDVVQARIAGDYKDFNLAVQALLLKHLTPEGFNYLAFEEDYKVLARLFAARLNGVFVGQNERAAAQASKQMAKPIVFDPVDPKTIRRMEELSNRVITALQQQQREAQGIIQQMAAEAQVKVRSVSEVQRSLTLSPKRIEHVNTYRTALEERSKNALTRTLRDKRFDPSVTASVKGTKVLTPEKIDRMVTRYAEKQLASQARTVAATEAVRITNEADMNLYEQAIDRGDVERQNVSRTWINSKDDLVRDTHDDLGGSVVTAGQPWESKSGALLMYPGDPNAPAAEIINCRCWVETNILKAA